MLLPDSDVIVRHVYSGDVARLIAKLIGKSGAFGQSCNLCQAEAPTLADLVGLLADIAGAPRRIEPVTREHLHRAAIPPEEISPFSTPWMSLLDPGKACRDLDFRHEPLSSYLGHIVAAFFARRVQDPPASYAWRKAELELLAG